MSARIITFGCRLNANESQAMAEHAEAARLDDAVIVNTCAVTGEAVRQARQAIRRARRDNPEARIIVTGCAAQTEPDRFAEMAEVDHVIGNAEKMQRATFERLSTGEAPRALVNDIMSVRETAGHMIADFGGRARAFVQIQNGCDHRCTFCIIPYGRGPSRSVPAGEVVRQIRTLVEQGYREVVLTGVDLTAYGADLPGDMTLGKLTRKILKLVPELPRLRISSIDTIEADGDLITAMAEEERLMPHLHLSLQAGDDMILKRMKRRHSRDDAVQFCAEMRRLRPDIAFGADIIAGFPTETEEMFANSLALVDDCGLSHLHVFPFSPRPGTPAARMPQLERQEIKARAQRLREKGQQALNDHLRGFAGRELEILMEQPQRGRAPQYAEVKLPEPQTPGEMVRARITDVRGGKLEGTLVA
ncbi:tRNA (N(6)-L-threonylcarbamoyladenosine(37)-C(2))-methylthiotransferase MtaB [Dichotomicrobium thermohalophilum]|uniref:tRNA (N(6)-L-threonylcarbamoyladenosine(37)-C(2))-methylthiotransferase n=1 Tax=Dichotomicrobium thermohalophilum TaxID=933063 RepID=A0A397Q733_9HYPH|nr:tRNA (N(6)-L-threonylcarbamoyladenosine(37)-C(2))-methylthiotransferase MtaB [Dichotomicrobium thermohalophilum]RIA56289.1 threonylcarbamoyladenosine tRNA methylthiotransferase MtaB [Dichotomicrobium thermohalophilum]